jgi:hypothetical protein
LPKLPKLPRLPKLQTVGFEKLVGFEMSRLIERGHAWRVALKNLGNFGNLGNVGNDYLCSR